MVFPSLIFHVEPGLVSQLSAIGVLIFSFLLQKGRKIFLSLVILFMCLVSFRALGFVAGNSMNTYQIFQNSLPRTIPPHFYGSPYGYQSSLYFYPHLVPQYFWPPRVPYYFTPFPYSPYAPQMDCIHCLRNPTPAYGPQFPFPMIGP